MIKTFCVIALFISATALAKGSGHYSGSHSSSSRRTHVEGYTKKDGTYVAPHDRTSADSTKTNNWSTKGNVNPDTGKAGTKNP